MTAPREVTLTITEGTSMAAAVSPDQRWIAIDLLGSVWILPARGGEAKKITPDMLEARQPSWAPDGETLAFQGYGDDGVWHIYAIGRKGDRLKQVTDGMFDDREPAWSHDGLRIAFSSDRTGGIYSIWQVIVGSGTVGQVVAHDSWMPAWARDDREIAFVTADRVRNGAPVPENQSLPGIWAVDENGRERQIALTPGASAPSWSPDGLRIAFVLRDNSLVTVPARSTVVVEAPTERQFFRGDPVALTRREDVFPFRPQWLSPTSLLYTSDGHIRRRSLRTGDVFDVPFTASVTLKRPVYSIAHRVLDPIESQRVLGIVAPAVSPDGRAIAFVALGDLWVMPIGGAPVRLTNDEAVELDPAWSPDLRQLAYSSDRAGNMDLWLHDFETNQDRQLTRDAGGRVTGAAWSHDGSQIAVLIDRRDVRTVQIRRGDCPGGGERSGATRELGRPSWAPDCKAIGVGGLFPYSARFREGLNQLLLFDVLTHGWSASLLFPEHSAGNRQGTGPVWSPDGFSMAFTSDEGLFSVAVDAIGRAIAPPVRLSDENATFLTWEGDSRHLVYLTAEGLRRIASEGGASTPMPIQLSWRSPPAPPHVVVHAGRVLDGTTDYELGESDIVIDNGFITEVAAHDEQLHTGEVIDASGEVVMPGLIEMHAHHDRDYGAAFGRLWLAYGITSVRIPAINPYEGLELREAFDSSRRRGPRVFIAGDPFDGSRVYYPGGVSVASPEQLERALQRAAALDVDFFKTYVRLPNALQRRVVEYAHDRGRPVTSHELFPAVAFGIDGIEHLRGTSRRGYSPKLSAANVAYRDVVDVIAKSGVTLTPTIGIQGGFNARETGDRAMLTDNRLALFPSSVVLRVTELATAPPDPRLDVALKPYETMLKAIVTAGGTIVAGTDSPIIPYGLGLHVELEEFTRSGMTPFQALQTATVNAARALGLEDELGTIEPGKRADLTFLGSDPLLDIRNTRDVRRVMRGGRVYTLAELVSRR